jgi:hypothetical protein
MTAGIAAFSTPCHSFQFFLPVLPTSDAETTRDHDRALYEKMCNHAMIG